MLTVLASLGGAQRYKCTRAVPRGSTVFPVREGICCHTEEFRAMYHCSCLCSRVSRLGAGRGWRGGGGGCVTPRAAFGHGGPCANPRHGCSLQAQGRQVAAAAPAPPPCLLAAIAARGQERHSHPRISPEPCWFPVWAPRINPRRGKSEPVAMRELGQEQPWPIAGLGAGNQGVKALGWCRGSSPVVHPSSGIQAGKALSL